ncbi:hypothetical protein MRB53_028671 [Persea americana]|uniref:Uncharacterized protein n=1 Tax=Persea americana TaxID=3435 RepID=A0ACC2KG59_PERAE|nr:hypothetical protein MRB53_028671 [Persea americana]
MGLNALTADEVDAGDCGQPIDEEDWYTVYSFPAGTYMMPSASLFFYFQDDVSVMDQLDSRWETFCTYHVWKKQ